MKVGSWINRSSGNLRENPDMTAQMPPFTSNGPSLFAPDSWGGPAPRVDGPGDGEARPDTGRAGSAFAIRARRLCLDGRLRAQCQRHRLCRGDKRLLVAYRDAIDLEPSSGSVKMHWPSSTRPFLMHVRHGGDPSWTHLILSFLIDMVSGPDSSTKQSR